MSKLNEPNQESNGSNESNEPDKPKQKRATQAQKLYRIDVLLLLKAKGHGYNELVELVQKTWKLGERQVKNYLKWAAEAERKLASQSDEERYSHMLNRVRVLIQQAIREGNLELANKLTQTELKVIESMKKHAKGGKSKNEANSISYPEPFSDSELASLLGELEEGGVAA